MALFSSPLLDSEGRVPIAFAWLACVTVGLGCFFRRRWRVWSANILCFGSTLIFIGWSTLQPSNQRNWQPDVAKLSSASIDGELVTIRNVRNITYRSEEDFIVRYDTRTYDLRTLASADLIASYWMGPSIAHIMISFGFGNDHLVISIEARKEIGEQYSTIKGFFRQYELVYVVADERDVLQLRTNFRKNPPEDVYLFRLMGDVRNLRRLFMEYIGALNELNTHPAWYNAATSNCTSNIWLHTSVNPGHVPMSWKILLSGYVPAYLYDEKKLVHGYSFSQLKEAGYINARAHLADQNTDFSERIRVGVPGYIFPKTQK